MTVRRAQVIAAWVLLVVTLVGITAWLVVGLMNKPGVITG